MDRQRPINASGTGLPVLYERGGPWKKEGWGFAVIICGKFGEKLPVLARLPGKPTRCSAVFVAKPGYHRVLVWQEGGRLLGTLVQRLDEIRNGIASFTYVEPDSKFNEAIQAGLVKACTHGCSPVFYGAMSGSTDRLI